MKKLIMMMALAVGLTGFAAQNDKLISFYTNGPDTYADGTAVVDGECYALVWVKTGAFFGGFNADGSAADSNNNAVLQISPCAKGGKCDGVLFHVAADQDAAYANTGAYQVYLMDTRDAAGVPSAVADGKVTRVNGCGLCPDAKAVVSGAAVRRVTANLTSAGVAAGAKFTADNVAYADNTVVLDGERVVLAGYPESSGKFHGIDWNFKPMMAGETCQMIGTVTDGKINVEIPDSLDPNLLYEVALIDSRVDNAISSAADGSGPKLVSGWLDLVLDAEGKATSGQWHTVKMGLSATYPVLGKGFDFDPTPYLEGGYAAIFTDSGVWQVYKLPQAWVASYEGPVLSKSEGTYWHLRVNEIPDPFTLESAYKFSAFSTDPEVERVALKFLQNGKNIAALEPAEQAVVYEWASQVQPFWGWNADFEVSFDHRVKADSVILAGFYHYADAWKDKYTFDWVEGDKEPWVGSSPDRDFEVGDKLRLLKSYIGKAGAVTMNYEEICTKVVQFLCGVKNLKPENWGTTMRVDLKLYENTGRCNEKDGGVQATVGTYKYTFKGPLNVEFYNADGTPCTAVENISTNHEGRIGFQMPTISSGTAGEAFVGWTNANGVVVAATPILVHEVSDANPIKSWYAAEEPLKLYASFKPAQTLTIQTNAGKTEEPATNVVIKVTDEWIEKNIGKTEDVAEIKTNLEKKVENPKSDLTYWQAYLLGIDPKDPSAELKVEQTNGKEEDKALVVSTVQVAAPDAGIKVGYSLDKVGGDEASVAKEGEEQTSKDLKIDLDPEGDTPTGYYKMNVIFTPTETRVGGETVEGEKVKIPADNTIGVLKVENTDKVVPVAVPWTSLESSGAESNAISVAEIVKTSTLTEKDMMHVYNAERGTYDNWELQDNKWVPVQSFKLDANGHVTKEEAGLPETNTIARGSSVWLERQNPEKPFYLIGQYDQKQPAISEVKAPEVGASRPEYNLIAPTGIEPTDLNEVKELRSDAVGTNDKILLFRNGVPFRYTRNADKKWGYWKQVYTYDPATDEVTATSQFVTEDTKVDAGLGLWYISGGGSPTINWNEKAE